jgi:hypothetical protein
MRGEFIVIVAGYTDRMMNFLGEQSRTCVRALIENLILKTIRADELADDFRQYAHQRRRSQTRQKSGTSLC